jgi:hypothetical protein
VYRSCASGDYLRRHTRVVGVSGEETSQIAPPGFPLDFGGARLAYGGTFELIDDHRGLVDPLV